MSHARVEQTDTFRKWLGGLEDRAGRARVLVRIDRLIGGNPGQHRQLAGGVSELKIDVGPGSRLLRATRFDAAPPASRRRQVDAAEGHRSSHPAGAGIFGVVTMKAATKKATKTRTMPYDTAEHLRTPDEMAAYLDAWLDEAPEDAAGIAIALGNIARAKGMTQVAKDAGLSRESLYRALSADGNPSFATVLKVARALGVKLHAAPA